MLTLGCVSPCEHGTDWWLDPKIGETPAIRVEFQCRTHSRTRVHEDTCDRMQYEYHLGACWDYDAGR
jgi:hypothetical protein